MLIIIKYIQRWLIVLLVVRIHEQIIAILFMRFSYSSPLRKVFGAKTTSILKVCGVADEVHLRPMKSLWFFLRFGKQNNQFMAGSSWFPQNLGANLVTIPCVKLNLSRMVACLNIILPKPPFFFMGGGGVSCQIPCSDNPSFSSCKPRDRKRGHYNSLFHLLIPVLSNSWCWLREWGVKSTNQLWFGSNLCRTCGARAAHSYWPSKIEPLVFSKHASWVCRSVWCSW